MDFGYLLLRELFCFLVIQIPFKVVCVSRKFCFRSGGTLQFFFRETFWMPYPWTSTEPTKFALAVFTSHVIAPLVFLNGSITMRTYFTIEFDVIQIGWVILFLFFPFLQNRTGRRSMVIFTTLEAETLSAFTLDRISLGETRSFNDIITILLRTPFDLFVQISKLLTVPGQVLRTQFFILSKIFDEIWMWNNYITSHLRAFRKYAHSTIILHLALQIVGPACCTELMAACKLIRLQFLIIWVKLHKIDVAHVFIVFGESLINIRILLDQVFVVN